MSQSERSRRSGLRSRLIAVLAVTGAAGLAALPADAAKPPPPEASVSQSWSGCEVTIAYDWSGFRTKATIRPHFLLYKNGVRDATGTGPPSVDPSGGHFEHTLLRFTSDTANSWHVEGMLIKAKGERVLRGSLRTSEPQTLNCG